jgi:hypothetical protein
MIMVDGFGVPPDGWNNSIYSKYCSKEFINLLETSTLPIDACLGVEGIPQSATGQTALFTGYNGSEIMGEHTPGFPGPLLREAIKEKNIFTSLEAINCNVTFANAYVSDKNMAVSKLRFRSVTTVMSECIFGAFRRKGDLLEGRAVYHDITHFTIQNGEVGIGRLKRKLSPPIPELIAVSSAAKNLLSIAKDYDFTLFEYFLTDKAGHSCDETFVKQVLGDFQEFVLNITESLDQETALLITSDHGNIEDLTTKRHTTNPVPLLLYPNDLLDSAKHLESIMDVHDYIVDFFVSLKENTNTNENEFSFDNPFDSLF